MASRNISFDTIPASIRKPGVYMEFNTALAVRTLPANLQKMLIIAQKTSAGSVAPATPVQLFSDAEAATQFGAGSQAHLMVRAALKANPYLHLSVCALNDATATAAAWTVTLSGNAGAAGFLRLWIGSRSVEISVASGDTPTAIATALTTELGKYPDLPVTAGRASNVVTLTARNQGTVANQLRISSEQSITTTTCTIAQSVTGATDPDLDTALAAVAGVQYDVIATSLNDATSLGKLKTHLDLYSGPLEQKPGVGVFALDDTVTNGVARSTALNSGRLVNVLLPGTMSPTWETAAAFAAVMAHEEDPARPLNTLALVGIAPPPVASRLTRSQQETCLLGGVTPLQVGAGEAVQIVRAVTTYTTSAAGSPDISLLDVTTIRTLDYVRKACRERCLLRFPREKLSARTPDKVRSEILDVLLKLEDLEIVEEVAANKAGLIAERDLQDPNRLNVKIPTNVVNGLHVLAARIDLIL